MVTCQPAWQGDHLQMVAAVAGLQHFQRFDDNCKTSLRRLSSVNELL